MPRLREVSRIEGFSDAVFAFSITLLVVSLEVPKTYDELIVAIRGFPTFAVCFALLFQVWWRHYRFFRTFDLEDNTVIALTAFLLFVVLFYVYPLKFLWSLPFAQLEGRRITDDIIATAQVPQLFTIYGAGVTAVFSILALLYRHAYRLREHLDLTPEETLTAKIQIYSNVTLAGWGIVSITLAQVLGRVAPKAVGIAGFIYSGIGISEWIIGDYHGRMRRRLPAALASHR
jgi:uncharacterized membrane protein